MATAKIPPLCWAGGGGMLPGAMLGWGSGDRDAALPWGCCGGMQDAAELRGRHSPRRCQLSPWLLSGREGNSETLFKSEVCWSLYLDAAPLLNLVFSSLIQELFQSPCWEKHGVAVGWVILGGFFPPFMKGRGLFGGLEAREGEGRGGGRRGGSAALSSFVRELRAHRPPAGEGAPHWGQLLCLLMRALGRTRCPEGPGGSAVPGGSGGWCFHLPSPGKGSLRAFCREALVPVSGERGEGSVAASC